MKTFIVLSVVASVVYFGFIAPEKVTDVAAKHEANTAQFKAEAKARAEHMKASARVRSERVKQAIVGRTK